MGVSTIKRCQFPLTSKGDNDDGASTFEQSRLDLVLEA